MFAESSQPAVKAAFVCQMFPKFVLGFLVISLLATIAAFSGPQAADLAER
jgi:hypothetical protein